MSGMHEELPSTSIVSRVPASAPAKPTDGRAAPAVPARPTALSATPDVVSLLRALQRRWALALSAGLLSAAVVAAVSYYVVPPAKYTALSTLRVSMHQPKVMAAANESPIDYLVFQKTQGALIKNRMVLAHALSDPAISELKTVKGVAAKVDPIQWLETQIKVEFPLNQEVMQIMMSGDRPDDIEKIVDAVTDSYMKLIVEADSSERSKRADQLLRLHREYQDGLKLKRKQLRELALSAGSDDRDALVYKNQLINQQLSMAEQERRRLRSELTRLKIEEQTLKAAAKDPAPADEGPAIQELIERDPMVAQYRSQLDDYRSKLDRHMRLVRNSTSDPAITALRKQIAMVQRLRDERIAQLKPLAAAQAQAPQNNELEQIAQRIASTQQWEAEVAKEIEAFKEEVNALNKKTLDLQSEKDEIAIDSETAKKVRAEAETIKVELQAPKRVQVLVKATAPRTRDEMRQIKVASVSAAGAFAFALFGVSFWEFRARRVNSVDQVVHDLGLRLVGCLPALVDQSRPRLLGRSQPSLEDRQALLMESIDAIRAMILHMSRVDSLSVVMVTSALEGEGKTSLSGHLATSLARAGRRTLLIDCDLRRPALHRIFDLPQDEGLCELLRGELGAAEVVCPTPVDDLFAVTAGRSDALALQALARGDLHQVLEGYRGQFDFIVLDTAPILPVADSLLVAQHADAVVFSILHEVSRLPMVYGACERLSALGVRVLGAVLAGTDGPYHRPRYAAKA